MTTSQQMADRQTFLRGRALQRADVEWCFAQGYAIDPDVHREASHEVLLRVIFGRMRTPKDLPSVIAVDDKFVLAHGHLLDSGHDLWREAQRTPAPTEED